MSQIYQSVLKKVLEKIKWQIHQNYFSGHFLAMVVVLQVIMYVSLFLNFPLVRQVVGIVYLTVVPGLIFIKLLKLDDLGTLEIIVFAVGFSVAFLNAVGANNKPVWVHSWT